MSRCQSQLHKEFGIELKCDFGPRSNLFKLISIMMEWFELFFWSILYFLWIL